MFVPHSFVSICTPMFVIKQVILANLNNIIYHDYYHQLWKVGKKERSKNKSLQRLFSSIVFINNFRAFIIWCDKAVDICSFFLQPVVLLRAALLLLFSNRWQRLAAFVASFRDEPAVCVCVCTSHVRAQSARQRRTAAAAQCIVGRQGLNSDHPMLTTNPNALWDTSVHYIRVQKCSLHIRTLVQNGGAPFQYTTLENRVDFGRSL